MDPFAKSVVPIRIEEEMRSSYMDYSMSVIIGRALPDVRDGLKPVHRRILYAMYREGLHAGKKYSKCAGVVGEVLKKYHPHGDSAVYDALVRMAQPWNLRYVLIDGQGNFGSIDGDPAAAYRYTECRMTRLAEELLTDIDKETVDFSPNFDGATEEPDVLPSRFPNLLVNGADGIAVGMATKIPPHNLTEVVNAAVALIENPDLTVSDLAEYIQGPDFPTGGTIYGRRGVREAYETGRGRIVVRGTTHFEDVDSGRRAIIVDEVPYQVNKARLIEQIADLVKEKRLDGISAIRDESDRQGMRVVIEIKRDAFEEVVLNHLFKHTALQSTFGVILLAIVNNRPRVLSLKELLQHYLAHRREVILRRTRHELRKARERAHILEGYRIALDHLDEVIALIRASATVQIAREGLVSRFGLSEIQADAILEMRLQRLTGMERQKIEEEYAEVMANIAWLESVLASEEKLMGVVRDELLDILARYGDQRRTRIIDAQSELTMHDLVAEEDQVVTLSHRGYIKRCSPDEWRQQKRGGLGKMGMTTRDEDFVENLFIANTHSLLLVFSTGGKVFPLWVYDVPEAGRGARGRAIVNLVPVPEGERIASVVSMRHLDREGAELLFVSRYGIVKRTSLELFKNLRQGGLIAAGVAEGDELVEVLEIEDAGKDVHVMLFAHGGRCIRFDAKQAPLIGRTGRGNFGIKLPEGDFVVHAMLAPADAVPEDSEEEEEEIPEAEEVEEDLGEAAPTEEPWDTTLLTVTELGLGKRTPFQEYRVQNRYGKGLLSHRTSTATGGVVGAVEVRREDELMVVTNTGRIIRISAGDVRLVGRVSRGVRLMRMEPGERLVSCARLEEPAEIPSGMPAIDVDEMPPERPGMDEGEE